MMGLVDYGSSDDEGSSPKPQESKPAPPPSRAPVVAPPPTGPKQINLGSLVTSSKAASAPKRRQEMFFRSDADDVADEADNDPDRAAKRVHGSGTFLVDMLPPPKNKSAAAASIRLPTPVVPKVQEQIFNDEIEEEVLSHKISAPPVLQHATISNTQRKGLVLGGGGFGGSMGLEESYGGVPETTAAGGVSRRNMDEPLNDPSLPEDFRQHFRKGVAKVVEVDQSQLRKKEWNPHTEKAIPLEGNIAPVMAPGRAARATHQITYLAFKAHEMEQAIAEKRAQGYKTKSETAAKYGW